MLISYCAICCYVCKIKSSRQVVSLHLSKIVVKQRSCVSSVDITVVSIVKYRKSSSSMTPGQSYDPTQESVFCFKPKMYRKVKVWYLINRVQLFGLFKFGKVNSSLQKGNRE